MMHAVTSLLTLVGFALLGVSMERHRHVLAGLDGRPTVWRAMRGAGWLALGVSLAAAVGVSGVTGLAAWFGHLAMGAGIVMLALVIVDRWR